MIARQALVFDSICQFLAHAEKFGNAVLFLRLGVPSMLIRLENGAFGKVLQTGRIRKHQLFVFAWADRVLRTEVFKNDDT